MGGNELDLSETPLKVKVLVGLTVALWLGLFQLESKICWWV